MADQDNKATPGATAAEPTPEVVTTPAAAPTPVAAVDSGAQVIDIETARSSERASLRELATQINQVCALANHPELAGSFIAAGETLANVQTKLLELKAKEAESGAVDGKHDPLAGARPKSQLNPMSIYENGMWNRNGKGA